MATLRPFVERIWSWRGGAALPTVVPGTGAELFLHLGDPFLVEEACGAQSRLPAGHLLCLRTRACRLAASGPIAFVAVRFRAGALRHFTALPLAELNDRFAPVGQVLGEKGEALLAAVKVAPAFADQVRCIEAFLLARLARHARPLRDDRAVALLYYGAGRWSVGDVAARLGLSHRQLERVVGSAVGLGPKRFQRLARFHHVMRRLLLRGRSEYLRLALEYGYYDQAHFIHEVRALTGRPPRALLTPNAFASHFYNPPLAPSAIPGAPQEEDADEYARR
jgi:AraC-like DNA-binding protein